MASPGGPPPPVSNPITGTWRNSFADKDQKGRALQKFDRGTRLRPLSNVLLRTRNLGQHFFDISKINEVNQSLVSLINDNY
jgi:hypothetical protein